MGSLLEMIGGAERVEALMFAQINPVGRAWEKAIASVEHSEKKAP